MRSETVLQILSLAEAYAQGANSPRRASTFQALEKAVAELAQDKARLDWLEQHSYRYAPDVPPKVYVIAHSSVWPAAVQNQLRQAIDRACAV